jgi:CRP-like cAMP-binding protein/CheY-like chemotaxis protein
MKRILLIEEDFDIRENIVKILKLSNYSVVTAKNGKIGVQKALEGYFNLIICDIMMSELDGYGVLRILSKNPKTSSIPFIFISEKSEKQDFHRGMQMGADDYLTKPFADADLLDAIELRLKKAEKFNKTAKQVEDANGLKTFIDETRGFRKLEDLAENREIRHYRKKDKIFNEGELPLHIFHIKTGRVKIYRTNKEGRELIVALIGPGELFGYLALLQGRDYPESAVAMAETELSLIPNEDFYSLVFNDRDVAGHFLKLLSGDLLNTEEQLIDLAYNSVRKRVADALIHLKSRYDKDEGERFTIAILRDDLANMVGTAKETVIRMLSDFKEEKLIEIKGSKITILNKKALEEMWQ